VDFAAARVARLATITPAGRPHVVPCCFSLDGTLAYTAIDNVKPKSTVALRRLDNIRANPAASLLVDHYSDDWSELWWIRADGVARIDDANQRALDLLCAKYEQYRLQPPPGPFITIEIRSWASWPS
jgi:PPOX class probable F420-dependent enzyme